MAITKVRRQLISTLKRLREDDSTPKDLRDDSTKPKYLGNDYLTGSLLDDRTSGDMLGTMRNRGPMLISYFKERIERHAAGHPNPEDYIKLLEGNGFIAKRNGGTHLGLTLMGRDYLNLTGEFWKYQGAKSRRK